jgi:prolyl oligopeptidase
MVCACLNQRPDLYGAGVAAVGVLDMLRFHQFTIGHFWCSDYGNADNKEGEDARWLLAYSPLHNVKARKDQPFPAIMLTTADHDDRVAPLHSFKMAAELQYTLGTAAAAAVAAAVAVHLLYRSLFVCLSMCVFVCVCVTG